MEITDKTSKEVKGKIEITETRDKAEYIAECEAGIARQVEIIEYAQAIKEELEAELAKYKQ